MLKLVGRLAALAVPLLSLGGLYFYALHKHEQREEFRHAAVTLTPNCIAKLGRYALTAGNEYESPYMLKRTGMHIALRGYSDEDVRAIERGCNIVDDTQGRLAQDPDLERWNARRFIRGAHANCDHCHRDLGDKQDAAGNRQKGTLHLGASWVMADMYDRFTGLLLPYELRQMQCYINSSNGFKPNAADDVLRDVTAYSRFLAAALDLRIGNHYPEQGIDEIPVSATLRRGDDYVRGADLYRKNCAACHGPQGFGTEANGKVLYPALAGPNSFSLD